MIDASEWGMLSDSIDWDFSAALAETGGLMKTIGIRSTPSEVIFAIYEDEAAKVINVEAIKIPSALSTPESLKYIRSNLLDVLREYEISKAGIRTTEPSAQSISIERIQIEGVIQEAFASSNLTAYFAGPIASIAAKLGINRADFKKIISGENPFEIENWGGMKDNEREAILAARGAASVV
jgi:Holliday junction resolvasome RuvABC endonuclease subunit